MSAELPSDPAELTRQLLDAREELERIKLTLDVVGTIDLFSGILNRNGLLESLERGRRWMARRGDIFGAVVAVFPEMPALDASDPDDLEIIKHLAATIGAGVREVDEVGRLDESTFAASLADLKPGAIHIVADRVTQLLTSTLRNLPAIGTFRVGAVEVLNAGHAPSTVIETCVRMAHEASAGSAVVGQM